MEPMTRSSRSTEARRLADAFPSPPCWLDVPGAGHTDVIDIGGDELLDRIAAFLDEATQRRRTSSLRTTRRKCDFDCCPLSNPHVLDSILRLFQRAEHATDDLG